MYVLCSTLSIFTAAVIKHMMLQLLCHVPSSRLQSLRKWPAQTWAGQAGPVKYNHLQAGFQPLRLPVHLRDSSQGGGHIRITAD